jgi:tagaturonate reductase
MKDKTLRAFMEKAVFEEIVPFVKLDKKDVEAFAASVFERFENPFIKHSVLDISLNSVSKWKARVLPSFKDYVSQRGALPPALTMSFAALLKFYDTDGSYPVRDDEAVLEFINENRTKSSGEYVRAVMKNQSFWGEDLTAYDGFEEAVVRYLDSFNKIGARETANALLKG